MKILYITTSYILKNSSAAIRNNSLVKGLIGLGHEVDVYTVKWSKELHSPFFEKEKNGNIHYATLPNLNRIDLLKRKTSNHNVASSSLLLKLKGILKKILFFPDECYELKNICLCEDLSQYGCVITSSDHKTSHFVGLKIKKANPQLFWMQIWGDPWNSDVNTLSIMKGVIAYYEKKLLISADKVVYVSFATMTEMKNKYPKLESKMYYIPRGYYFNVSGISTNNLNGDIRIVYTGAISWGRNIFQLLNVLVKLEGGKRWIVDVYGNYSQDINEKLLEYPFVHICNGVDFDLMYNVYSSASILLYLSNKKGSTQIPGKFFDYMGTNKPILCLVDDVNDDVSLFLAKYDKCIVTQNTETCITEKISEIEKSVLKESCPNETFSPEAVAKEVIKLMY